MIAQLADVSSGMIIMGCLVVGLFFVRFWKNSKDRLFLIFAAAFWLMGASRVVQVYAPGHHDYHVSVYLIRLASYVLILIGVIDKNRQRRE